MSREELIESLTILKEQAREYGDNAFIWSINIDSFNFVINSAIKALEQEPTTKNDLPKYCDRNICLKNEYSNIGCDDCEVTKSQEPTPKNDLVVDCIDRQATLDAIIKRLGIKNETYLLEAERVIYQQILAMPSVTPQLSIELEKTRKNSKELEKNFGESDCISRAEVIDVVENTTTEWLKGDVNFMYPSLIKKIKELPSATPQEPRKGHWIVQPSNKEQGERDFIWWKCSECGHVIFSETLHDRLEFHAFCGRCGADMRGEE